MFTAILALYLVNKLGFTENDATALYHGFIMTIFGMCLVGGIISDVWLGKYKTILYLSFIYVSGIIIVAISSISIINCSPKLMLILGMVLIAFGSGGMKIFIHFESNLNRYNLNPSTGIKPNVCAFGGDQFKLPEQASQFASYFSLFYCAISSGGLLSTIITPILREDFQCFGDEDCYPLAFGVPAILMFFAIGENSFPNERNKFSRNNSVLFVFQHFLYLANLHIQS